MSETKPPKDCLGTDLHEGDWITLVPNGPLICRVKKIDNGGILTPQGITPAVVKIYTDITLRTVPGGEVPLVVRVVSPGSEKAFDSLLKQ